MPSMPESHGHITRITFDSGDFLQAPTDQWIALLFDVLHPTQQEAIVEKIQAMQQAMQQKPRIEVPGFMPPPTFERH